MKVDAGLCLMVFLAQNFHTLKQFSAMLFHICALSCRDEGPFDRLSFSRAVTIPWWIQLTSGLELLIAVGGVVLISFRLAMAFKEWKQK